MALGESIGEFSLTSTGVTVSDLPGGGSASQVNFEGTATAYGTVIGTLTFLTSYPGAKSGEVSWRGKGYLDNGDSLSGKGEGTYLENGTHQWRIRILMQISDGTLLLSDGTVHLNSGSYQGELYEWE